MDRERFRRDLLAWYDANRRDLPWRRTAEPYRVLLSEVMCQQTRIDVVIPRFDAWMERWPSIESFAAAHVEEVMAQWSGLGYYRRARNLHAAAKQIVKSGWPKDLQELAGVGPYIAGAVGSIAFGHPVAAIDGNVERVLARTHAITDNVRLAPGRRRIQDAAEGLLDGHRPGDWTQALMELGALVCTPRAPRCGECPVRTHCQSRDDPTGLPRKTASRPPMQEEVQFALVTAADRILLTRRPPGLLGGTWALPGGTVDRSLGALVEDQTGVRVEIQSEFCEASHTFSHRKWRMRVHRAEATDASHAAPAQSTRWIGVAELDSLGMSTAMRKAMRAAGVPV